MLISRAFSKPSVGLEPTTPAYHGGAPKPEERQCSPKSGAGEDGLGACLLERLLRTRPQLVFAYCDNVLCPQFCPRIGESNLTLLEPE